MDRWMGRDLHRICDLAHGALGISAATRRRHIKSFDKRDAHLSRHGCSDYSSSLARRCDSCVHTAHAMAGPFTTRGLASTSYRHPHSQGPHSQGLLVRHPPMAWIYQAHPTQRSSNVYSLCRSLSIRT